MRYIGATEERQHLAYTYEQRQNMVDTIYKSQLISCRQLKQFDICNAYSVENKDHVRQEDRK